MIIVLGGAVLFASCFLYVAAVMFAGGRGFTHRHVEQVKTKK
jgi:hypothetical protein